MTLAFVMDFNSGCDIGIFWHWPTGQWSFEIHWPDLIFTGPEKHVKLFISSVGSFRGADKHGPIDLSSLVLQ